MQILTVPKEEYIKSSNTLTSQVELFNFMNKHGIYIERDQAEKDPNYLQLIPYILVTKDDTVFLYSRLKKGAEKRLHNKLSVGIGGHVDKLEDTLSCKEVFMYNANKELYEELNVELNDSYLQIQLANKLVYDDSNEVGRVHLGVLMTCDVSGREVSVKEIDKIEGRFYTHSEIKELYFERQEHAFETWTTIALKHVGIIE